MLSVWTVRVLYRLSLHMMTGRTWLLAKLLMASCPYSWSLSGARPLLVIADSDSVIRPAGDSAAQKAQFYIAQKPAAIEPLHVMTACSAPDGPCNDTAEPLRP